MTRMPHHDTTPTYVSATAPILQLPTNPAIIQLCFLEQTYSMSILQNYIIFPEVPLALHQS
ncbi:hypothetical protein P4K96_01135, partial [Bacillus cereus]|nr:hypothetical protein [Bacillus cereus]